MYSLLGALGLDLSYLKLLKHHLVKIKMTEK